MSRLLPIFAVAAAAAGVTAHAFALPSGDDDKNATVEVRLLKILKERGVIKENEYDELLKLGREIRAEESMTSAAIERELADLSEKMLRQADAKKADPETKVSYALGKGVTFSQGDAFSLNITAFLQPRFSFIAPKGPTKSGNDDRASFDLRRAEIVLSGNLLNKDLTYKLQFDPAPVAGSPLRDAFVNYRYIPELQIRAGQMRPNFSRQNFVGSDNLEVIERSSAIEVFRSVVGDRDNGVMLWGELDHELFEWYAGVFNGEGLNNGTTSAANIGPASSGLNVANASNNDSSGVNAKARIVFNPNGKPGYTEGDLELTDTPKVSFGVAYDHNPERRGNPIGIATGVGGIPAGQLPNYDVDTWEGDFALKYRGLYISAEYFYREIAPTGNLQGFPGSFNTSTMTGGYAQAGYFMGEEKGKGAEVALRYSTIDWDQNIAPASVKGGVTKLDDYTAAFNYYWLGHSLKFQVAYTYRVEDIRGHNPAGIDQIFQAGLQLKF
ncbi:MAG: hypothetical protein HY286_18300 [Planctomycetes bacterium]|nr:hypothetical protein [Planctomycetota bacterium]